MNLKLKPTITQTRYQFPKLHGTYWFINRQTYEPVTRLPAKPTTQKS